MMLSVALCLFAAILLSEVVTLIIFKHNYKKPAPISEVEAWPLVSILIAARNEEQYLQLCLETLKQVDYPKDKLKVLIGNDQSTDNTQQIIDKWINEVSFLQSVPIEPNQGGLIAKSNVLAQLADKAEGDYLVILDADTKVTPHWLKAMVAQAMQGFDLVSGYTEVESYDYFSHLQKMDWRNSIHSLKTFSDVGFPLSALGNNMLITRTAYDALGGFRALGATKVEDLKLTKATVNKRLAFFQLVDTNKVFTYAIPSFTAYVLQRKRWLSGVIKYRPLASVGFVLLRLSLIAMIISIGMTSSLWQAGMLGGLVITKLWVEHMKQRQIAALSDEEGVKFSFSKPFVIAVLDTFALIALVFKPSINWKKRKY